MTSDAAQKRALLEAWLQAHQAYCFPLHPGGPLDIRACHQALRGTLGDHGHQEGVYVLVRTSAPTMPLYVGRSKAPLTRWRGHLQDVQAGKGRYAAWPSLFANPLSLYVVPMARVKQAPIPDFPVTVGSVESQLISLAQDAYPGLLNVEGVGR